MAARGSGLYSRRRYPSSSSTSSTESSEDEIENSSQYLRVARNSESYARVSKENQYNSRIRQIQNNTDCDDPTHQDFEDSHEQHNSTLENQDLDEVLHEIDEYSDVLNDTDEPQRQYPRM